MPNPNPFCGCSGRDGFTRLGDDFVCAKCMLPRPGYEGKKIGLAYFQGGPMDGKAYTVATLLSGDAIALPITEYRWTTKTVQSQLTGKVARVWVWKGDEEVAEARQTVVPNNPNTQEGSTPVSQESPSTTATADEATRNSLLERRSALGLSRPEVVAHTNGAVTVAQLSSLERSGKRVKDGILEAIHNALTHLEHLHAQKQGGDGEQQGEQPPATDDAATEDHTTA